MSERLERAKAVWTRPAISIQARGRDEPHQQAGHTEAPEPVALNLYENLLHPKGRPHTDVQAPCPLTSASDPVADIAYRTMLPHRSQMTDNTPSAEPDLQKRVLAWLETEGFPTEFRTTMAFRAAHFLARQGVHYRADGAPREIDLVADRTVREDKLWVRCKFVVECKWASKPWIVFTDRYSSIAPAACISQTMGSKAGNALLWLAAGSSELQSLTMFATPDMPGFGGRQAFSKGDDQFYKAMAGVTTAASTLAASYDEHRKPGTAPEYAICVFPIIVVEGPLFRSFYDAESGEMKVEPAAHVRCHWKGSPTWEWHATVDIVTLEGLPKYLAELSPGVDKLLDLMIGGLKDLRSAFASGSLASLKVHPGARGMVGIHPLLAEIKKPAGSSGAV